MQVMLPLTARKGDAAALTFSMTQATVRAAQVILNFPASGSLDRIAFLGGLTGTSPTYTVSLQAVNSDGVPMGTILGGGSPASADFTISSGVNEIVLDNPHSVTSGDDIAIVFDYSSGTIGFGNFGNVVAGFVPDVNGVSLTGSTSSWSNAGQQRTSLIGIGNSTDYLAGMVPSSQLTALTTGTRFGCKWQCPSTLDGALCVGMQASDGTISGAITSRILFRIRKASDDSVLGTYTLPRFHYAGSAGRANVIFDTPFNLVGGEEYYILMEEDSGSGLGINGCLVLDSTYSADSLGYFDDFITPFNGLLPGYKGVVVYDGTWTEYPTYFPSSNGFEASIIVDLQEAGGSAPPSMRGGFIN